MIGASFDSTKTALQDLLARADNGKLQLPDFQRGWVWDDDHIRSLIASVSVSTYARSPHAASQLKQIVGISA